MTMVPGMSEKPTRTTIATQQEAEMTPAVRVFVDLLLARNKLLESQTKPKVTGSNPVGQNYYSISLINTTTYGNTKSA